MDCFDGLFFAAFIHIRMAAIEVEPEDVVLLPASVALDATFVWTVARACESGRCPFPFPWPL